MNAIVVESAQVACAIILNESVDDRLLLGCAGKGTRLFQVEHHALDGSTVETTYTPYAFTQVAKLIAYQAAVHSHHHGARVAGGLAFGVKLLSFLLCDSGSVVVAGRSEQQVVAIFLVDTHGHHRRVEDDGEHLVAKCVYRLTGSQWQFGSVNTLQGCTEEVGRKFGLELLASVMVMDACGEPYALQVSGECAKLLRVAVAAEVGVDSFEHTADAQVVASVLIEKDVATLQSCFREIVDEGFLFERQLFKSLHLIAKHLNVGKLLVGVLEVVCLCRGCGWAQRGGSCEHHSGKFCFHV